MSWIKENTLGLSLVGLCLGAAWWIGDKEELGADFVECNDESCDTGHCPTCGNCWDGIEVSCSKCGDDWGGYSKLLDRELYGAEVFVAEWGGDNDVVKKIGEVTSWKGKILGMEGMWKDGTYHVLEILGTGFVILHTDIDFTGKYKYEMDDEWETIYVESTDIAQITFAGMTINTGSDGGFAIKGMKEELNDIFLRQNDGEWDNDKFVEWLEKDERGFPSVKLSRDKLCGYIAGRVKIVNPEHPVPMEWDTEGVWKVSYGGGSHYTYLENEEVVKEYFAILASMHPQGDSTANSWTRAKYSYTIPIPYFPDYTITAYPVRVGKDVLSQKDANQRWKEERERKRNSKKSAEELGAESFAADWWSMWRGNFQKSYTQAYAIDAIEECVKADRRGDMRLHEAMTAIQTIVNRTWGIGEPVGGSDAESFEAPKVRGGKRGRPTKSRSKTRLKYRNMSKAQKRWVSDKIKTIMRDWKQTGRIGNSRPTTTKAAQRQAIAVAYSMATKRFR